MVLALFVLFVIAPVIELGVFLQVAGIVGIWPAVLAQLVLSALGLWVLKRAGTTAVRRARATVARGEIPSAEFGDGALHLLAGVLLVLPGFVTGLLGLLLLAPPVRNVVRRRFVRQWMVGRRIPDFVRSRSVVDVEWVGDVTPRGAPSTPPRSIGRARD